MKKLLSLILAMTLAFSALSLTACNIGGGDEKEESGKCLICKDFGDEIAYKIDGLVMEIGNPCLECGFVEDPIEVVELDAVVSEDMSNGVTDVQQKNPGQDLVIGLKKGYYPQIFVGDSARSVHVICETGTQVRIAQANGDAMGVTFENMYFYTDPTSSETMSQVKFETAGGHAYWNDIVVKNCTFEGKSKIDSSWKNGVIDNMTVEGCTFKNLTGWSSAGSACAIFTDENWGETIIRDCVFDNIDYAAIRFGRVSTEGHFLIENCFFRDIKGNACIMFSSKNATLAADEGVLQVGIVLEVKNNVFADSKPFSYSKSSNAKVKSQFIIGTNTWLSIPASIKDSTYYDIREQLIYEGEI